VHSTRSLARAISLQEAVAIALEANPDLAAVANELTIAQSEIERANYISQFNPELLTEGDYRYRSGRSNSQEWRGRLSQQLEIFGQPALRRRAAAIGYQGTQANVRNQVRLLTASVKMTFYEAIRERDRSELFKRFGETRLPAIRCRAGQATGRQSCKLATSMPGSI
jgi:outer membrane protein TolC